MAYPHNTPSHYNYNDGQSDYKSYDDDLVDERAAPYAASTGHQTFTLPDSMENYGGMTTKPSYSTESTTNLADGPRSGYPPPATQEVDNRTLWQKLLPDSMACRLYILTVIVETAVDLIIEGDLLLRFNRTFTGSTNNEAVDISISRLPVDFTVFVIAHIFQFIMALDAVYARNTLQFMFLAIFNLLLLVYAGIQTGEIAQTTFAVGDGVSSISPTTLSTVVPIVIALSEVAYVGLGWKIYHEFGWKVYKYLGADRRLKKMYASYQIYQCLVKFDVFFWVGYSVQLIWLVLKVEVDNKINWEYYVTCAVLPVSLLLLIEGYLAARHENKWMMFTFMSGCGGGLLYFCYKSIKIIVLRSQFDHIWKSLTIFSGISIILLAATIVYSIIVLRNFGKGLSQAMDRSAAMQAGVLPGHQRAASKHLNRMSIN